MIWTPEKVEQLRAMRTAHKSIAECAKALYTTNQGIYYACRTFGIVEPPKLPPEPQKKPSRPKHKCDGCEWGTMIDDERYYCPRIGWCKRRVT